MKKVIVGLLLSMMLASVPAMCVGAADPLYSPTGNRIPPTEGHKDRSPKTGDLNILFVEGIGAAAAVVAVVTRKKRHA